MSDESQTGDAQPTLPDPAPVPAEPKPDDGSVVVKLVADGVELDLRVPPRGKWRSVAMNRLTQMDSLGWAVYTLSPEDADKFLEADPTWEDFEKFMGEFNRLSGVNNRADRRRHLRAAS